MIIFEFFCSNFWGCGCKDIQQVQRDTFPKKVFGNPKYKSSKMLCSRSRIALFLNLLKMGYGVPFFFLSLKFRREFAIFAWRLFFGEHIKQSKLFHVGVDSGKGAFCPLSFSLFTWIGSTNAAKLMSVPRLEIAKLVVCYSLMIWFCFPRQNLASSAH